MNNSTSETFGFFTKSEIRGSRKKQSFGTPKTNKRPHCRKSSGCSYCESNRLHSTKKRLLSVSVKNEEV